MLSRCLYLLKCFLNMAHISSFTKGNSFCVIHPVRFCNHRYCWATATILSNEEFLTSGEHAEYGKAERWARIQISDDIAKPVS